jgi:hypothetical protein
MAFARWQATITDEAGDIQPLASVTVRREVAGSPLASIYSDRDGATPLGNPFTATSEGFAAFHANGGAYKITATLGGFSREWRYVGVGTASEFDATDGAAIIQEVSAGFALFFSTTTTAPPGAGQIRFNNASLASATECYIDAENAAGSDISDLLMTLFTTGQAIKHRFIVTDPVDNSQAVFSITGATDNTTYITLSVTYIDGATTFTNTNPVTFMPIIPGADGVQPGLVFAFDSSTSMADPGTGDFRLNHATLSSVTAMAIDDLSAITGNPDVSAVVLSWDDSTQTANRGTITIKKVSAPQNIAVYRISGASTDNSGWTQLALTYIGHAGSFTNGDTCVIEFSRSADTFSLPTADETTTGGVEMATEAEIYSAATGAKALMAQDLETAAALVALSSSSNLTAVNWDSGVCFSLSLGENTTISNPTNGQPGTFRHIYVVGSSGTRTVSFGNQFLGELPTITDVATTKGYVLSIMCLTASHFTVSSKRALG